MAINFPEKPDIPLKNAPLLEVVCQVRVPPILRISKKETPIDFQEKIRDQFPLYELEHSFLAQIPGVGSEEKKPSVTSRSPIQRFRTTNNKDTISLAVDFFAVATKRYTHWQDFANCLLLAGRSVQEVYRPNHATRIGLRYINKLTPQNTGCLTLNEIFDLLHPNLTTFIRSDVWSDPSEMRFRIMLTEVDAKLNLRTGHGTDEHGQPYFLLDFDYYEEGQLSLSNLIERCDHYHDAIYRAFRWCIPEEKLTVFQPAEEV